MRKARAHEREKKKSPLGRHRPGVCPSIDAERSDGSHAAQILHVRVSSHHRSPRHSACEAHVSGATATPGLRFFLLAFLAVLAVFVPFRRAAAKRVRTACCQCGTAL